MKYIIVTQCVLPLVYEPRAEATIMSRCQSRFKLRHVHRSVYINKPAVIAMECDGDYMLGSVYMWWSYLLRTRKSRAIAIIYRRNGC